jgi:acetylornithine/N-succinyldiaminopimelate aminotransferase
MVTPTNRQLFLQHLAQTSDAPLLLEIAGALGNYLIGQDGKKYLDLISGISVSSLGHGLPQIVEAVKKQASNYMHTMVYGEFVQAPQVRLAQQLTGLLPETLNSVYLVNSGSEATEGAMKLAKRATGRSDFVALTKAYHGSTQGALSLMTESYYNAAYRPLLPNVRFMEQNRLSDISLIDQNVAAVFIEPVQGEKGAVPCSAEFLHAVRDKCTETGALLVFDEIQTGMGRTGRMFAMEYFGVYPDILLLGKAFGGGMPLGAFVASRQLTQKLSANPVLGHISTFGGHPVSCAAASAALQYLTENLLSFEIEAKNKQFQALKNTPGVLGISGTGLLLAIDVGSEERCKKIIQTCLQKGVFTDWFLYAPERLRVAPPLTITIEEIDMAVGVLDEAIRAA